MNLSVVLGSVAVVGSLFVLWWAVSGERTQSVYLDAALAPRGTDRRTLLLRQSAHERVAQPLFARLGAHLRPLLPHGRTAALARKIQRAGSPKGWSVERVLATKVLLGLALGIALGIRLANSPTLFNVLLALGAALFGYFAPDGVLDSKVSSRQAAIRMDVADTIDEIAVMVRAGLGIDGAILRAAKDGTGPLAEELARVVQDMRVGVSRGVALAGLADRTDVPELRGFVGALAQAEKLGVPISHTLQVQSAELRTKKRQLAEEQAAKLPVKILFPMVFFILPVIFIVLLGPAAIRIMEQFSK